MGFIDQERLYVYLKEYSQKYSMLYRIKMPPMHSSYESMISGLRKTGMSRGPHLVPSRSLCPIVR